MSTTSTLPTGPAPRGVGTGGSRLEIDGVSKYFGERSAHPFLALDTTDVVIESGEFVSVVGPSGCGKSTLMLMVAGLLDPTHGSVSVDGTPLRGPVTDVGIAFQDHLLLDFRTAMDNVLLQAQVRKLDKAAIRKRAEELFEQLGLTRAATRYPRQLSGGMRQRVSLVRTLVHRPRLLMMDEPFGALDALTRLQVRSDLEDLWMQDRPTVLFITHSVEEAVGLSDRILVMSPSPGRIVDEITVELERPRPLSLAEQPQFTEYCNRIYGHFERMGVLGGHSVAQRTESAGT